MKLIICISLVIKFLYDEFLTYLDYSYIDKELPENVKDVYNEDEYKKWKAYQNEGKYIDLAEDVIDFLLIFCFIIFNVHSKIFYMFDASDELRYLYSIIFFSIASLVIDILFDYYDTFVIEEKYGFNKSTKLTFFIDIVKSFILSTGLTYVILIVIKMLYERFGNIGLIYIICFMLLLSLIIVLLVMPIMKIFNKFKELEDGELRQKLEALCEKYNVKVKKIVIKDASKRTTKSNAFCTGLGKRKTISFDDNLVNNFSTDEIVAVFAHEFAHAKYKHMLKSLPFGIFRTIFNILMVGVLLNYKNIFVEFGFNDINYMFAFVIYGYLIWVIDEILDLFSNVLSRKHEYEADAFAAKEGYGVELIKSLKKLYKEDFSDINPHPLVVKLSYFHPTLSQRIQAIDNIIRRSV